MPAELSGLTSVLAKVLGFQGFKAEAAIVNYYRMNSTLAGHTDHSEVNVAAPLFSISFGQTAIFLIGGSRQEDPADAMLLRSGDVVVMSGDSRLRYHGVPKILPASNPVPWDDDRIDNSVKSCTYDGSDWRKARTYIAEARININARQVLKPGQIVLYWYFVYIEILKMYIYLITREICMCTDPRLQIPELNFFVGLESD